MLVIVTIIDKMKVENRKRETKQKRIVLEELAKVKSHPSADALHRMCRRRIPNISLGTVYRNLNLLRDEGKVLELACGKYTCHYDATVENHYHFYCLECKKIFDIDEIDRGDLYRLDKKAAAHKFQVKYHRVDFYGSCQECRAS